MDRLSEMASEAVSAQPGTVSPNTCTCALEHARQSNPLALGFIEGYVFLKHMLSSHNSVLLNTQNMAHDAFLIAEAVTFIQVGTVTVFLQTGVES